MSKLERSDFVKSDLGKNEDVCSSFCHTHVVPSQHNVTTYILLEASWRFPIQPLAMSYRRSPGSISLRLDVGKHVLGERKLSLGEGEIYTDQVHPRQES